MLLGPAEPRASRPLHCAPRALGRCLAPAQTDGPEPLWRRCVRPPGTWALVGRTAGLPLGLPSQLAVGVSWQGGFGESSTTSCPQGSQHLLFGPESPAEPGPPAAFSGAGAAAPVWSLTPCPQLGILWLSACDFWDTYRSSASSVQAENPAFWAVPVLVSFSSFPLHFSSK